MRKQYYLRNIKIIILTIILASLGLASCAPTLADTPVLSTATLADTPTSSPSPTAFPSLTPTEMPVQILVFYGDSSLAIGDAGDNISHVGFSFVSNLSAMLDPTDTLITANYGGRTAKWAYENLSETVLPYQPDLVTLWWGFDDMGGCPGTFDRNTNQLVEQKTEARIAEHISYMELIIETLLSQNILVFVMTPVPALQGNLPWSHLDENNKLIWESTWCHFNEALQLLVQAQRDLVSRYRLENVPVYLVDVWQIYMDHPDAEKMYMDVVHPGSNGAQLIAEGWLEMFEASQR